MSRHNSDEGGYTMSGHKRHEKDCCCSHINYTNNNYNTNTVASSGNGVNGDAAQGLLQNFSHYTAPEQDIFVNPVTISRSDNNPTVVAQVTLDDITAGTRIWLNGLFGVDGVDDVSVVDVRIYGDAVVPGQEFYKTVIEVDSAGTDNAGQIVPVQDVQIWGLGTDNIVYILTVHVVEGANAFLLRPITFTALLIGTDS